jgi:O-antigen/teichoic acid export membrane protein
MLPSTLSVYLLPRYVRNRDNEELVRFGEWVTAGVTVGCGLAVTAVFWFFGDLIARLLYGAAFTSTGELLFLLSLAYLPWITAWGVFIRLIARGSRPAVVVLVIATVLQVAGYLAAVPNVTALIWVQAVMGIAVLIGFFVLVRLLDRPTDASAQELSAQEQVT